MITGNLIHLQHSDHLENTFPIKPKELQRFCYQFFHQSAKAENEVEKLL